MLLAVIGKNWLTLLDAKGRRRLDEPGDFVSIEIALALRLGKCVVPVLVNGAEMPAAAQLPGPLKPLARRNAVRLTHEQFLADVRGLVSGINAYLAEAEPCVAETLGGRAISIVRPLKEKYPHWIDPEIDDVRIVQTDQRVWLEITRESMTAGYIKDQVIKRSDLAFISDGFEGKLFRIEDSVVRNARKFVDDFDPYSIIMTTELFHEAACKEIERKHLTHIEGQKARR